MSTLRQLLLRTWDRLWRREHRHDAADRLDDRRRFWSEFREGQREAEEALSKNRAPAPRQA